MESYSKISISQTCMPSFSGRIMSQNRYIDLTKNHRVVVSLCDRPRQTKFTSIIDFDIENKSNFAVLTGSISVIVNANCDSRESSTYNSAY